MKKIAAILLIFTMLFSFAACKAEETETPQPSAEPVTQEPAEKRYEELRAEAGLEDNYHYEELKTDDGVVRFIVKMTLPKFTDKTCSEEIASILNYYYEDEFFEKDLELAETNKENAKKHMESKDSDSPWAIQVSYEVRYFDGNYICIVMKRSFSYGGDAEPVISARCFQLSDADTCSSNDFFIEGIDDETKSIIFQSIKDRASTELNPEANLTEEQLAKIDTAFDPDTGYYITEDGITFFFSKGLVDATQFGTYECFFPWNEVDYIYQIPSAE